MNGGNINELIQSKNYAEVGKYFSRALPDGSAVEFLENVIGSLNGGLQHKKAKTSTSEAPSSTPKSGNMKFVLNDQIDESVISLVLQVGDNNGGADGCVMNQEFFWNRRFADDVRGVGFNREFRR